MSPFHETTTSSYKQNQNMLVYLFKVSLMETGRNAS